MSVVTIMVVILIVVVAAGLMTGMRAMPRVWMSPVSTARLSRSACERQTCCKCGEDWDDARHRLRPRIQIRLQCYRTEIEKRSNKPVDCDRVRQRAAYDVAVGVGQRANSLESGGPAARAPLSNLEPKPGSYVIAFVGGIIMTLTIRPARSLAASRL